MAKKIYDLVVKTGTYEKDGETKGRYITVGAVMQNDDGGKFIMLNRTFNPAGVPNPDGRDTVICSMFEPKDNDGGGGGGRSGGGRGGSSGGGSKSGGGGGNRAPMGADDEIPF